MALLPRKASDKNKEFSLTGVRKFDHLPLSSETREALKQSKYKEMTAIQRATIPHAMCGRDVLGAAKTGSGKTLSYIVPSLEKLWRMKWGKDDGVGAIFVSPTRELAMQIFAEIVKVGCNHSFSVALLIGGKDLEKERNTVNQMNLLCCTPGRLLQHMDETPMFDCANLQVLVLDEADRILDLGFSETLDAVLQNLPKTRQTLLFSATQTKKVSDLARLSLKDPEFLSVHAESTNATPPKLQQMYTTCAAEKKIETLWAFVKSHSTQKILIFFSSCKQVKFVHEIFKRMRPGIPLACIHGRMKQQRREHVFYQFCNARETVLFATDVASRGLDFPAVDWVVQCDCPEDVQTYIHRVGRTARYKASGKALMLLNAGKEATKFPELLEQAKIPIKSIKMNPKSRVKGISSSVQGLLSKDNDLKYLSQRALVCYLRSVFLQKNKDVFDVSEIDIEALSTSFGLPNAPKVKFLNNGAAAKKKKNSINEAENSKKKKAALVVADDDDDDDDDDDESNISSEDDGSSSDEDDDEEAEEEEDDDDDDEGPSSSDDDSDNDERLKSSAGVLKRTGGGRFKIKAGDSDDEGEDDGVEDDFLKVTRKDHALTEDKDEEKRELAIAANADGEKIRQKALKGKLRIGKSGSIASVAGSEKRIVFKDDGTASKPLEALGEDAKFFAKSTSENDELLREAVKQRMQKVADERKSADYADRGREKARLRDMRAKRKVKDVGKEETRAFLAGSSDDDDDGDGDDDDKNNDNKNGDNSDSEPFDSRAFKATKRSDPAYAGMGRRTDNDDEGNEETIEQRAMRLLNEKLG